MFKKYIIFISILTFIKGQDLVVSKQFKFFKSNNLKSVNILDLINEKNGIFKVEFINLEDLEYKRYKKTLNPFTCELEFEVDSYKSKPLKLSICKNEYLLSGDLIVDESNPNISISHEKFTFFEATIVLVVSGIYKDAKNELKNSNSGVLKEWYDNGNLYLEYKMKDGIKNGLCKKWYEDGQLMISYNYKNGKLHGNQKKWHNNGKIKGEWNYSDDIENGIFKEWYQDGSIKLIKKYKNGLLIEKSSYDSQGNKLQG